MKRCPECRRDYFDDSLVYCLDDGSALLEGPAGVSGSIDEPRTAILHATTPPAEAQTRAQIHSTDQTSVLPSGISEPQKPKTFDKRLLLAPLVLAAIVLAGFAGYRYFNAADTEQVNSIAVLPFENRSGSGDTEYLSDGLADSLIYRLSQLPNLKVSPTSSVMRYKGKETDVAQIARDLAVDAVMSGRLVQRGDDLSISVQLIDARTEKIIWAEQYDRKMAELLATQREIATTITQKLKLKLGGAESKGIVKKYTDSNEAYQAYLKGRYYWNRRTAENLKKAIEQFKAATERDSNFALAFVGLADCYALLGEYAGAPSSETIPKSKAFAERALQLDSGLGEVHATLALVADYSWQWAEAEREFKFAMEANPNYPTTYHWYSISLKALGKYDEADAMIRRAQELDPLSSVISVNITRMLQIQKNDDAAIQHTLKLIELDPNFPAAYQYIALSYARQGRFAEAISSAEKSVEMGNRSGIALGDLGFVYALAGRNEQARSIIKELEAKYARGEAKPLFIAVVYAGLAEKEKMFEWLEKGVEERSGQLAEIRWQMPFDPFRDDPRFKSLLKRMNLPE